MATYIKRQSISQHMAERFHRHRYRRITAACLYISLYLCYLCWRITIFNEESITLSSMCFIAECFGFILGLGIITSSSGYHHRDPAPPLADRKVDVFIPTYKEPIEVIRMTAIAAKEIHYPHKTWILDDGKREEIKELAHELGIHYLSRPQNIHAKAGNLNFGLAHSEAEFILVLDADHIPLPHALDVTLGLFANEKVGLVQTPQDYFNTNAFQYVNTKQGALWHDQSFFYSIGQSCADGKNATSCVGTGVIYRRSALDKIGGIPTTTVTEDIHTSLKMNKMGMDTVYFNEPISYGEAATDLKEYYKTRQRWGHGNLHALQNENILFCKGLTWKQRWVHLSLGLIYLEGWQQLLLFSIPIITLAFGLQPFDISIFNIFIVSVFPIISYLLLQEIGCGFARFWTNEIFAMARWPVQILATAGVLGKTMPWRTSLKHVKARVHWDLMLPQISVMLASLGALTYAIIRVNKNFQTGPLYEVLHSLLTRGIFPDNIDIYAVMQKGFTVDLVIIAGFWALYNSMRVLYFIGKVIHNARHSSDFTRFELPLTLYHHDYGFGRIRSISETSLSFYFYDMPSSLLEGDIIPLTLHLPAGSLEVRIAIEQLQLDGRQQANMEGHFMWGVSLQQRETLGRCLYSIDWHREFLHRHAYFKTPIDSLWKCFTLGRYQHHQSMHISKHEWSPILYIPPHLENASPCYGAVGVSADGISATLISFVTLAPGDKLHATVFSKDQQLSAEYQVIGEEPVSSLVVEGLDKMVVRRYSISVTSVTRKTRPQQKFAITSDKSKISLALSS